MARRLVLPLLAALCLAPATAQADVSDFGSDLSLPATMSANHGSDTSYWNIGGAPPLGGYVAPAEGQVTVVQLKGAVLPNPNLRGTSAEDLARIIHFQVLRDTGDGRFKVVQLSTGHMQIPVNASPENVVTRYEPVNLCVRKGDVVAFNTIGAHEYRRSSLDPNYQGAEYQVFGRIPGPAVQWYEKDNGLNEGTRILPSPNDQLAGQELLMRTTLSTGPDATDICPGGFAQHVFRGADINPPPKANPIPVRTKDRVARVRILCPGESYGGCVGTLRLLDGNQQELGSARFDVINAQTEAVDVPLSDASIAAIQTAGSLRVTAVADATDKPGSDSRNTGAPGTRPGPQAKTTTEALTLKPDRAPCIVPKVVGKSSSSAKSAIRKAGCANAVKYQKGAKPKQIGKVISISPAAGSVLSSGSKVTITVGRR